MDQIKILEEQVKALEKLLQIKNQIIQELEKKQTFPYSPNYLPAVWNPICVHEYGSTIGLAGLFCRKCGAAANFITYTNNTFQDTKNIIDYSKFNKQNVT